MALNDRNSILTNPDDRTTDSGMTPGLQFGSQQPGGAPGGLVGAAQTTSKATPLPNSGGPMPAPPESPAITDRPTTVTTPAPAPQAPPPPYIGANTTTTGTNTTNTGTNAPGSIVGAAQGTALTDPSTIKPVLGTVNSDQLVEDRLTRLLGSDSPLIARARQRAAENATARGLQNSTMAVQAGESAAIDAALPIATSDASTYSRQSLANQDSENQFLGQDKQFAGQRVLANEDRTFQGSENQKTRDTQSSIAAGNNATQMQVAQMDAASRAALASQELQGRLQLVGIDADTRTTLAKLDIDARTSQNIAQLNQNSLINFSNGFANIQSSSMEQDAKLNATRNYLAIWAGSPYLPVGIDLSRLPTSTTTTTDVNVNGGGGK